MVISSGHEEGEGIDRSPNRGQRERDITHRRHFAAAGAARSEAFKRSTYSLERGGHNGLIAGGQGRGARNHSRHSGNFAPLAHVHVLGFAPRLQGRGRR